MKSEESKATSQLSSADYTNEHRFERLIKDDRRHKGTLAYCFVLLSGLSLRLG
jgi:hypothetical protein